MPSIDRDRVAAYIIDVANDKIVPRFRQLQKEDVRAKTSPSDLVTIADIEAEHELTRILSDLLPGSQVVGEEAVSDGAVSLDLFKQTDGYIWVIDPVDGTNNFATGKPVFGTMVALVHNGRTVMSWIYQIPQARMVSAEKGGRTLMNGHAYTPPEKPANDMDFKELRAFISSRFMPPKIRSYVEPRLAMMADASTHMCCAHEYVSILEGDAAFSIYKRIKPWDHLAGVLILEEAGFHCRKWDGTPYTPTDEHEGLISAPSEVLWHRVHDLFLKGAPGFSAS